MSIQSLDDYLAAQRQVIPIVKLTNFGVNNSQYAQVFSITGPGGYGSLDPSTVDPLAPTQGTKPVAGVGGYPKIEAFPASGIGYLTRAGFSLHGLQSQDVWVCDRLYQLGPFNSTTGVNVSPSSPPSYLDRLPNGDATGTELWLEAGGNIGPSSGTSTYTVTYTNEAGVTGRTATVTLSVYRPSPAMVQIPLQAGDKGVQSIQNFTYDQQIGSNPGCVLSVLRPLTFGMLLPSLAAGVYLDLTQSGMPQIFATSALMLLIDMDNLNVSMLVGTLEIASK